MATAKPASKPTPSNAKTSKAQAAAAKVKSAPSEAVVQAPPATTRKPARAKAAPAAGPLPDQPQVAAAAVNTAPAATSGPAAAKTPKPNMKSVDTPPKKATQAKSAKKPNGGGHTDADVLAMSEDEYMNEIQLAFFRAKLEATRDEILANARETGEHLKENEVFADPNDRATVEEENMLEQRVRDRERKLLKKINSALARIEDGSYGYCLETGDPIGIPRLLARPTAELSIEAQEKHERLEKLFAD